MEEKIMLCRKADGTLINLGSVANRSCASGKVDGAGQVSSKCGGWKFFYANCPRTNYLCSATSGAWLPAITVCRQSLYSWIWNIKKTYQK